MAAKIESVRLSPDHSTLPNRVIRVGNKVKVSFYDLDANFKRVNIEKETKISSIVSSNSKIFFVSDEDGTEYCENDIIFIKPLFTSFKLKSKK